MGTLLNLVNGADGRKYTERSYDLAYVHDRRKPQTYLQINARQKGFFEMYLLTNPFETTSENLQGVKWNDFL